MHRTNLISLEYRFYCHDTVASNAYGTWFSMICVPRTVAVQINPKDAVDIKSVPMSFELLLRRGRPDTSGHLSLISSLVWQPAFVLTTYYYSILFVSLDCNAVPSQTSLLLPYSVVPQFFAQPEYLIRFMLNSPWMHKFFACVRCVLCIINLNFCNQSTSVSITFCIIC